MYTYIKIILFSLIFLSINVFADSLVCIGMFENGKTVHVLMDLSSQTIIVNGNVYKISGKTNNNKGYATENYTASTKSVNYLTLITEPASDTHLNVFDAKKDTIKEVIQLSCHND